MNVKSIYETLAALGTSAMIAGCGASQAPTNTAEQPLPEASPANTADPNSSNETASKESDTPRDVVPVAAVAEQKPAGSGTAESSSTAGLGTIGGQAPSTTAAKATPVKKKAAPAPAKTPAKTAVKKDAANDCGEGGCAR